MNEMYFRTRKIAKIVLLVVIVGPLAILLFGGLVMYLWNAILPGLLHAGVITFWQAVGLLVLCKILFGSMGSGRGRYRKQWGGPPPHLKEKFMNMSEEEKAAFKQHWKEKWMGGKEE